MAQELIVKANGKTTKFLGNFSYSKDILDVRAIASFRISYTDEQWKLWKPGLDKVELIGGVTGSGRLFYGHVTRVVKNEEFIDVSLEDMGYKMKATCTSDYQDKTLKEVITQLCKEIEFTPVFDNIPKDILNKKISSTSITESSLASTASGIANSVAGTVASTVGTVTGTTICADGKPSCSNHCGAYTTVHTCFLNYCPNCRRSGTLKFNPKGTAEGEMTCYQGLGGCDSDFCVACGYEKMTGSTKHLTIISGGVGTPGVDSSATSTTTMTYETTINSICADNNLYMCIDNHERCIIRNFTGSGKSQFSIKPYMIKKDTFSYSNGEANAIKKVTVKYKGGTVNKTVGDSSDITDKNTQTYTQSDMNQKDATEYAQKMLNQSLREENIEITAKILASPSVYPGAWVDIPKPTDYSKTEVLYVCGNVINIRGGEILNDSVTLKYAPPMPELGSGTSSSVNLQTVDEIGNRGAQFGYCHSCSKIDCIESTGCGDCYAMSDWLYAKLTAAGIKSRILWQSGPSNHRWVQILQGSTWTDFPYSKYHFASLFGVTSTHSGVRVYAGG